QKESRFDRLRPIQGTVSLPESLRCPWQKKQSRGYLPRICLRGGGFGRSPRIIRHTTRIVIIANPYGRLSTAHLQWALCDMNCGGISSTCLAPCSRLQPCSIFIVCPRSSADIHEMTGIPFLLFIRRPTGRKHGRHQPCS